MPPDVKQRALCALWRLLMTLGMFGVGYILWDVQVDAFPAFLVPSSWFLYCYMLFFPTSPLAAAFLHGFDRLQDVEIKILIVVFSGFLLIHLYRREPVGMVYIVALCIVHFCITQLAIYRAAMEPAPLPMCEAPQPDAPGAQAEDSDDTATDTDQEASLAAEPEHSRDVGESVEPDKPVEPKQMDSADHSHGPTALVVVPYGSSARKNFEPQPQVSGAKGALWSFLLAILTLGSAVLLAHALIDWSVRDWVLSPAPVDIAPLFEAEAFFQANKTELPIPVPHADFIPTGTFGSPCQAAPTPTPVDKSMMWRGIAMATPMPTPMPAPIPTAMPEPEPTAVPDEPIDVLKRLFYFDFPDPKPLLKWYFSLPPASQYTVLVICLLVLWCLSKPLITLAAHLVVLAIAYLASAAVLALLLIYGFTPERSLAIVLPADLALIVSIWWAKSWLKNLASTSWSNTAGLAGLKNDLQGMRARNEQRLDRADSWITLIKDILKGMTKDWADSVVQFTGRLNKHRKIIEMLQYHILALTIDKARQVDLDETDRIIDELSEKIDGLETSKGDADLLRTVQRNVDGLRRMAENIRTEKADAEELEEVQEELKQMTRRVDELQNTEADAKTLAKLATELDLHVKTVADVLKAQGKLNARVDTFRAEMDGVRGELSSLTTTSTEHGKSINNLEVDAKATKKVSEDAKGVSLNVKSDLKGDRIMASNRYKEFTDARQTANERYEELKEEITKVKEDNAKMEEQNAKMKTDLGSLERAVSRLQRRVNDLEAGKVTQDDLLHLRHDVTSDAYQKITQQANNLRSEANSQHDQVMKAHRQLEDGIGRRFAASNDAAKKFQDETRSSLKGLDESVKKQTTSTDAKFKVVNDIVDKHIAAMKKDVVERVGVIGKELDDHVADIWSGITGVSQDISLATDRVGALENQAVDSIPQLAVDDEIWLKVEQCVEEYLVSDKFRAAVNEAQLTLKQQSQRERLRAQVQAAMEELLDTEDVQQNIYTNFMERQALDNDPSGDPPGVISGGQASSPRISPSNSHAAHDSTIGNDDPLVDPPEVISGDRATVPGGMSSDNTTNPTIPEEPTISNGVEAHDGTRGVPLGDPPGLNTGGRPQSQDGTTSAGPSSDDGCTGPLTSSEEDDGMLQPKLHEVQEPGESDNSTDAQASGHTNSEETDERLLGDFLGHMLARDGTEDKKPNRRKSRRQIAISNQRKQQNEVTEKKEQNEEKENEQDQESEKKEQDEDTDDDDDDDDDAHDGGDDDEPHDNDPRDPPPGSGGSHGHNGTGGNDDDGQDGNDGGAPGPPRQTHGLANSIFAPGRSSGGSSSDVQHDTSEPGTGTRNAYGRNLNQQTRSLKYFKGLRVIEKESKAKQKEKELVDREEHSQAQPMPQQNALNNQGSQGHGKHRGKRGSGKVAKEQKKLAREQQKLEQQQQGGEGQNAQQA